MPYYVRTLVEDDQAYGFVDSIDGTLYQVVADTEDAARAQAQDVADNWNKRDFSLLCQLLGHADPYAVEVMDSGGNKG